MLTDGMCQSQRNVQQCVGQEKPNALSHVCEQKIIKMLKWIKGFVLSSSNHQILCPVL